MTLDEQCKCCQPSVATATGHTHEECPGPAAASVSVAPNICHVWLADATSLDRVRAFRARRDVLSEDERVRMSRFVFEEDRDTYQMAHVLARGTLSSCFRGVEPSAWIFERAGRGRPEIACPKTDTGLRFNISHTRGLAACIVTAGVDCGVDVERIDHRIDVEALVESVLTASETEAIPRQPDSARAAYFFRLWTLKEAYAKARGLGLELPFNRLAMNLDPTIRVRADSAVETDAAAWQFASWMTITHVAAVALRPGRVSRLRIIKHTAPPHVLGCVDVKKLNCSM